jgi:SNF2 family DNA or RNA helicase
MQARDIMLRSFAIKIANLVAMPHQTRVLQKLLQDNDGQLVYHNLGSGKTFTAINAAKQMKLPLLAIVPASLRNNFRKEITASKFTGEYKVVSYSQAVKLKDDDAFRSFASKALVVYDEAHRMGRADSQRSKLPNNLPAKKVLMLTGTPIRNRPEEIIPLIRGLGSGVIPSDRKKFKDKYITSKKVRPGLWGWIKGVKSGVTEEIKDPDLIKSEMGELIDFHESDDKENYPNIEEYTLEVPMSDHQVASYKYMMGKYPTLAYKVQYGIPPNKTEAGKMQAFLTGPRQVSNTPEPFSTSAKREDAPKILAIADEIEKRKATDANFKGVVYSQYLDAGINPVAKELERRNIPYTKFVGGMSDNKRLETIEEYNSGEVPVMLISGAGAEGLDLKGTKLLQIMEPHWNEGLLNQVKGRVARYKSHANLPPEERKVEIQRFHSKMPKSRIQRWLGLEEDMSTDEYMHQMAKKKQELNEQFLAAIQD